MQTAAGVILRPLEDRDFAAIARIVSLTSGRPFGEAEMRDQVREFEPERFDHGWLIAEHPDNGVVGYAWYHQIAWSFHPAKYAIRLAVHPDWQRRGIGRRLMDRVLDLLLGRGAQRIKANAREDWVRSIAFLRRYGFVERARSFESRLQVARCDLARFAGYATRVAQAGIVLTTLEEELRRNPDCLPVLYQLHCTLDVDAPRDDPEPPTPLTYETFLAISVRSPLALPDAYFLAKIGEMYVGESMLKRAASDPGWLHQELTGVVSGFRGLGIATALKLRTIEYAQRGGYREIQTRNSDRNAPMLAINAKLGFVRQPAWLEFQKETSAIPANKESDA